MRLQPASKKEITRIAIGAAVCLAGMLAVFFVLSCLGVGKFDLSVLLGGFLGTAVALLNFAALCLTIQNAAQMEDQKQRKAMIQLSYNVRLVLQAVWVVTAFLTPWLNGASGALPLLFPSAVIYVLRSKEKPATPGRKENNSNNI